MKLFVHVAFDLEDCQQPGYDAVEGWLNSVGLRRTIVEPGGNEVRLPANTFAGVRDCYSSREAAIKHVQEQFAMAARWDFCIGRAFITVSPADETTHDIHRFSI